MKLTNPRLYLPGHPKTFERDPTTGLFVNIDYEKTERLRTRTMPTEKEIDTILKKADQLETQYFQLRAKAIVGLVKIFGKRRAELSLLEMTDLLVDGDFLNITFTICKKSKKGLFQYFEFLEKHNPEFLNKPYLVLKEERKAWNKTKDGLRERRFRRTKSTPLTDKYARLIFNYYLYMQQTYPQSKYLFPSGVQLFNGAYLLRNNKSLKGRQILNIVKELDPNVWMHLFRKLKGSEVARKYGRTLDSAFQVKTTLDLERTETALRYIEDFVPKVETGEP
jgi:hypothetical protein